MSTLDGFTSAKEEKNPSLTGTVVEIKRQANLCEKYRNGENFLLGPAIDVSVSDASKHCPVVLTNELRHSILAPYEEGNSRIARDYLDSPSGLLFTPVADEDPADCLEYDEMTRDIIRVYTNALVDERNERIKLERKLASMEKKVEALEAHLEDFKRGKKETKTVRGKAGAVKRRLKGAAKRR